MKYPIIGTIGDTRKGGGESISDAFLTACEGKTVVVVTGDQPHIGKSTTVEALANAVGATGQKVLVIDADLRTRNGLSTKYGAMDKVCSTENFDIQRATSKRFNLDALGSKEFEAMVENARNEYDLVLIDTPPRVLGDDVLKAARLADGVVIVKPNDADEEMDVVGIITNAAASSRKGGGRYMWTR